MPKILKTTKSVGLDREIDYIYSLIDNHNKKIKVVTAEIFQISNDSPGGGNNGNGGNPPPPPEPTYEIIALNNIDIGQQPRIDFYSQTGIGITAEDDFDGNINIYFSSIAGILSGGRPGAIPFYGSNTYLSSDVSNLYWDYVNHRMGIGKSVGLGNSLHVEGSGRFIGTLQVGNYYFPTADGSLNQVLQTNGSGIVSWSTVAATSAGGNVGIGTTVTGAGASSVLWTGIGGTLSQNNSNFYWDDINKRLHLYSIQIGNYNLPLNDGSLNQVLRTDGSGNVSWGVGSTGTKIGDSILTGTPGSILFIDGSTYLAQDNSNLFWNYATKRLGINTDTPLYSLEVKNSIGIDSTGIDSKTHLAQSSTLNGAINTNTTFYLTNSSNNVQIFVIISDNVTATVVLPSGPDYGQWFDVLNLSDRAATTGRSVVVKNSDSNHTLATLPPGCISIHHTSPIGNTGITMGFGTSPAFSLPAGY